MKRTGLKRPSYAQFLADKKAGLNPYAGPQRRTPLRRKSPRRRREEPIYKARKAAYLQDHPWCMIWIAMHRLDEAAVIKAGGWAKVDGLLRKAPPSREIHHRNKSWADRWLDQRWWMASSPTWHDHVEANKSWARSVGCLLPIEADPDGMLPNGRQCLETPAFMESMALKESLVSAGLSTVGQLLADGPPAT
jgi:hypothetical protein